MSKEIKVEHLYNMWLTEINDFIIVFYILYSNEHQPCCIIGTYSEYFFFV